jgi:hypothetical protein
MQPPRNLDRRCRLPPPQVSDSSSTSQVRPTDVRTASLRNRDAGSITMVQIRSSTPLTTIPSNRKGRRINQTRGYKRRATNAIGQQRTSRMHHNRNLITIECYTESQCRRNVSARQFRRKDNVSHDQRIPWPIRDNGTARRKHS